MNGHTGIVNTVRFHPKGKSLASAGWDKFHFNFIFSSLNHKIFIKIY